MDTWLFTIMFIMMGVYYGGFWGLKRFNKRYEWFDGKRKKQPVRDIADIPDDEVPSEEWESNYDYD
jgi:hypothetical protein